MTITVKTQELNDKPVTQDTLGFAARKDVAALREAVQGFNKAIERIPGGENYVIEGVVPNKVQNHVGIDHVLNSVAASYAGKESLGLVLDTEESAGFLRGTKCSILPARQEAVKALVEAVRKATAAAEGQASQLTAGNATSNEARLKAVEAGLLNDFSKLPNVKPARCAVSVGAMPER